MNDYRLPPIDVNDLAAIDDLVRRGDTSIGLDREGREASTVRVLQLLETVWPRLPKSQLDPRHTSGLAEASKNAEPSRIDRFTIERELGRGGGGVVYLARDTQLDRLVAIKIPHREIVGSARTRERFLREARAAAALRHPGIVPILEVGESEQVCYIVYEYSPGRTLAAYLKERNSPVEPAVAAAVVADLAEALDHSHRKGIIHRDLKPGNVLLHEDEGAPGRLCPRIIDFGLAKNLEANDDTTPAGFAVGTAGYMSPEQARADQKAIGPASDQFSLGVIFYEMLTREKPFNGETVLHRLDQTRSAKPVAPRRLRPEVPAELESLCLRCLEKDPERRFPQIRMLADELRKYVSEAKDRVPSPAKANRSIVWRRGPFFAAAGAAVVLAIVSFAFIFRPSDVWRSPVAIGQPMGPHFELESGELSRVKDGQKTMLSKDVVRFVSADPKVVFFLKKGLLYRWMEREDGDELFTMQTGVEQLFQADANTLYIVRHGVLYRLSQATTIQSAGEFPNRSVDTAALVDAETLYFLSEGNLVRMTQLSGDRVEKIVREKVVQFAMDRRGTLFVLSEGTLFRIADPATDTRGVAMHHNVARIAQAESGELYVLREGDLLRLDDPARDSEGVTVFSNVERFVLTRETLYVLSEGGLFRISDPARNRVGFRMQSNVKSFDLIDPHVLYALSAGELLRINDPSRNEVGVRMHANVRSFSLVDRETLFYLRDGSLNRIIGPERSVRAEVMHANVSDFVVADRTMMFFIREGNLNRMKDPATTAVGVGVALTHVTQLGLSNGGRDVYILREGTLERLVNPALDSDVVKVQDRVSQFGFSSCGKLFVLRDGSLGRINDPAAGGPAEWIHDHVSQFEFVDGSTVCFLREGRMNLWKHCDTSNRATEGREDVAQFAVADGGSIYVLHDGKLGKASHPISSEQITWIQSEVSKFFLADGGTMYVLREGQLNRLRNPATRPEATLLQDHVVDFLLPDAGMMYLLRKDQKFLRMRTPGSSDRVEKLHSRTTQIVLIDGGTLYFIHADGDLYRLDDPLNNKNDAALKTKVTRIELADSGLLYVLHEGTLSRIRNPASNVQWSTMQKEVDQFLLGDCGTLYFLRAGSLFRIPNPARQDDAEAVTDRPIVEPFERRSPFSQRPVGK